MGNLGSYNDWVLQLNSIVYNLVQKQETLFQTYGWNMWLALSLIAISIWGIQTMFHGVDFYSFLKTVMLIVTVKAMLDAYAYAPGWIPGGYRFPDLIIEGPKFFASKISYGSMQEMTNAVHGVLEKHPQPSVLSISAVIVYWIFWLLLQLSQAVMFAITSFGLVAQAVCVMLGPMFVPCLLIKPFSFLFWGWLKSLLQYSFYPLVCACYAAILAHWMAQELTTMFGGDFSLGSFSQGLAMTPYIVIIILCMLTVPSTVSALFTGGQASVGSALQTVALSRMGMRKK